MEGGGAGLGVGWGRGYQRRLSRDLLIISLIEVNSVQQKQHQILGLETKVSLSTDKRCLKSTKYCTLTKSEVQVFFEKFSVSGMRRVGGLWG